MRRHRLLLSCLALAFVACSDATTGRTLTVFAAASTTDVVGELAGLFDEAEIRTSFGPTSGLARQIDDGAPADVFISASREWMEYLDERGRLAEAPRAIARSRLVCVAPVGSTFAENHPSDLVELVARLAAGDRVAIADPGVPAGEYARQSLTRGGHLESLRPHLVGQKDVRAVLRAVAGGEVVAGFVYATDARIAPVVELFRLDESTHSPIEFLAAAVKRAPNPDLAAVFLDRLDGDRARQLLSAAGFQVDPR